MCRGWVELDMLTCSRLVYVLRNLELTIGACRVKLTWAKLTWHQLSTVTYPLPHSHTFMFPSPSSTSQETAWEAHGGCDLTKKKRTKKNPPFLVYTSVKLDPTVRHGILKLTEAFGRVELML